MIWKAFLYNYNVEEYFFSWRKKSFDIKGMYSLFNWFKNRSILNCNGKQLLVFDENSSRALISLFLDCLPPIETIKDPSYENEWTSLLDGIAAVLYQTGTFIERSIPDTKRLEILFRQLLEPDLNTEIKCLLTQVSWNKVPHV